MKTLRMLAILVMYLLVCIPLAIAGITPPNIYLDDIKVEHDGQVITWFPSFGRDVNISGIRVESSDITKDQITIAIPEMGISDIHPNRCTESGTSMVCYLNGFMNLMSPGTYITIEVKAEDNYGNVSQDSTTYPMQLDDQAPSIISMESASHFDGHDYFGFEDNAIVITFNETQSGFSQKNVYVSLNGIVFSADDCVQEGDVWVCHIPVDTIPVQNEFNIGLASSPKSSDDAGNVVPPYNIYVNLDDEPPEIMDVFTGSATGSCITSTNPATIGILARDDGDYMEARADISDISSIPQNATGSCEKLNSTYFNCTVSITSITSNPRDIDINVWVLDQGGNSAGSSIPMHVCQLTTGDAPNCAKASLSYPQTVPASVDRKTASMINFPVMVPVSLTACNGGELLEKSATCSGPSGLQETDIVASSTDDPVIKTYLDKINDSVDSYTIQCNLSVRIAIGTSLYENPQVIPLTIEIPMYGSTLGSLDEQVQEKIDGVNEEISDLESDIESKESISTYFNYLCSTAELAGAANSALQDAKSVYWAYSCSGETSLKATIASQVNAALAAAQSYAATCPGHPSACACEGALPSIFSEAGILMNSIGAGDPTLTSSEVAVFFGLIQSCPPAIAPAAAAATASQEWLALSESWASTCAWGNTYHSFVENYIWPSGYVGPNLIGMIVKYSCIIYSCRLCSGEFWGKLIFDFTSATMQAGDETITKDGQTFTSPTTLSSSEPVQDLTMDVPLTSHDLTIGSTDSEGNIRWPYAMASKENSVSAAAPETWLWMPYKSIHYAAGCLCLPGIIYNLKKERQIKCMQRNCLTAAAQAGVSTAECDIATKERYCLYVDSAQYKLHGFLGTLFQDMVSNIIANLPFIVAGIAFAATCPEYVISGEPEKCQLTLTTGVCGPVSTQWQAVSCGLIGSINTVKDIYDIWKNGFSFDKYNAELEGHDYCSDINYIT